MILGAAAVGARAVFAFGFLLGAGQGFLLVAELVQRGQGIPGALGGGDAGGVLASGFPVAVGGVLCLGLWGVGVFGPVDGVLCLPGEVFCPCGGGVLAAGQADGALVQLRRGVLVPVFRRDRGLIGRGDVVAFAEELDFGCGGPPAPGAFGVRGDRSECLGPGGWLGGEQVSCFFEARSEDGAA